MEIRELRAFIVVATELNFRKAAEVLGMSQPPLTRLITNLEAQLGTRLFHRTTRSVELTGEGIFLLSRAREIVDKVSSLETEIVGLKKVNRLKIRIGLHHAAIHSEIPKLISSFKEQFPGVKIELVDVSGIEMEKKVLVGELELGIGVIEPKRPQIGSLEVNRHELGLLISKKNLLSRKSRIELRDLRGETLIFHGKDDHLGFQADFYSFLRRKKISVHVHYRRAGESCMKLTASNTGILISSRSMAPKTGDLVFVPFADFSKKLRVIAIWNKRELNDETKALLSFLQEHAQAPSSEMDYHFN